MTKEKYKAKFKEDLYVSKRDKKAYGKKTPVYYIDDDCFYSSFPVQEAYVIKGYISGYNENMVSITTDMENKVYMVNRQIYDSEEKTYNVSLLRFKNYVINLRREYEEIKNGLESDGKRFKELRDKKLI